MPPIVSDLPSLFSLNTGVYEHVSALEEVVWGIELCMYGIVIDHMWTKNNIHGTPIDEQSLVYIICPKYAHRVCFITVYWVQGPLLQTRFNFNPSMDKQLHAQ